jgi:hypothetical protein
LNPLAVLQMPTTGRSSIASPYPIERANERLR